MNTSLFPKVAAGATIALASALFYAGHTPAAAKTPPKPVLVASATQGKALVGQYGCNRCHAPNLAGRQGFSPSLYPNASLKEYKQASFVHMLLTGITPDGGHVKPPMPAYGAGMMRMRPGMRPGGMRPGGPGGPPDGMRPGGPDGGPPPGGMGGPGGPPPGGMRPGGMRPGGPGGPGGRNMPPPMTPTQAASIYMYLHTLK